MTSIKRGMLKIVAETGDQFAGFAPYVASINDDGVVAFQAAMRRGRTGVFVGDGRPLESVVDGSIREVVSHPDLNRAREVCFYAELAGGGRGVILAREGRVFSLADTLGSLESIGPLGPAMNEGGTVAFRGTAAGGAVVCAGVPGAWSAIADTSGPFSGFDGLPVVNAGGAVVFRANLEQGGQAICVAEGGALTTVADTRGRFEALGRFPVLDDRGRVAFCATRDGRPGVYVLEDGVIDLLVDADAPFESYRGVLINDAGDVIFYGTPRGGQLAIFSGPDPARDRVFGVGDSLEGSDVTGFALNPVSMNRAGQLAIRVELADGREMIVRVDA